MKIALIKKDNQLHPYYKSDIESWGKLKNNVVYLAEFKKPRNPEHHKKIFALANCVITNMSENSIWHNKEPYTLIKAIELELGYVEEKIKLGGEIYLEPESINFENWDQLKFQEFYNRAIPIMAEMIGCTIEDLETNSINYL